MDMKKYWILTLYFILEAGIACAQTPTTWPFFKNDVYRSSEQTFDKIAINSTNLSLKWQTTTLGLANAVAYSSPVISLANVYIAALDGNIYAYQNNPVLGSSTINPPLWHYKTDAPIYGTPAVFDIGTCTCLSQKG